MTDERLSRPGAEIAYDSAGDGPVVVQLHGLSSSPEGDAALGVDFGVLAERGHRLVRYDARGHGRSTGRPEPDDYRWTALADDLLALLDRVSPDAPADAIGESMGTATVLWAAVRHPERFRRLVLRIPPTGWETRAAQGGMYRQMADLIEARGVEAVAAAMAAAPVPPVIAEREAALAPQLVPELAPSVLRGAAVSDLPDREAIATLRLPVLLLPWAGDPTHPVSTAEQLRELIPGSQLVLAEHGRDLDAWPERVAAFLA